MELPPETQFLLAELPAQMQATGEEQPAGGYALILPLIDWDFRATLRAGRYVVGDTARVCRNSHLALRFFASPIAPPDAPIICSPTYKYFYIA